MIALIPAADAPAARLAARTSYLTALGRRWELGERLGARDLDRREADLDTGALLASRWWRP